MSDEKKTVLLVDDDFELMEIHTRIVGRKYDVLTAASAAECLELMKTATPDLIVMDVMMENISSGFDAAKKLKDDGLLKDTPLVFLTSVDDHYNYRAQVNEDYFTTSKWLSKPVKPMKLLEEVQKLIGV